MILGSSCTCTLFTSPSLPSRKWADIWHPESHAETPGAPLCTHCCRGDHPCGALLLQPPHCVGTHVTQGPRISTAWWVGLMHAQTQLKTHKHRHEWTRTVHVHIHTFIIPSAWLLTYSHRDVPEWMCHHVSHRHALHPTPPYPCEGDAEVAANRCASAKHTQQSSHLVLHALSNMHKHPNAGNTFITKVTEHITQFAKYNLEVELALNPSDESLQVSREKVNGHVYHLLKDGEITLPEPVGVTGCGCGTWH